MKKLFLLALLSLPAQADIYELDFNEDRAMWRGEDYTPQNTPFITKMENEACISPLRGIIIVSTEDNDCGYLDTTPAILQGLKFEYCEIAVDRGGDIDLQLAKEMEC